MNFFEEYEAEVAAKAKAEIAAETAAWVALTPEEQAASIAADEARRFEEDRRQERIAAQHVAIYGEDQDDEEGEDE